MICGISPFSVTFCILVTCFTFSPLSRAASQNLTFSQVLMVDATEDTVPPGKVWKVESALSTSDLSIYTNSTGHQNNYSRIVVNGINIYVVSAYGSSYTTGANKPTQLPFWMPAGSRLKAGTNVQYVSVIEFNVMP